LKPGGTTLPKLTLNSDEVANELFDLGDTLKATIIVSAAALLSRRTDDLEANAYSALARLEDMRQKLEGVRNGVAQKKKGQSPRGKTGAPENGRVVSIESD
jgi:hypothetical protein